MMSREKINEYRRQKRRERGLQKQGRKPNTPEQNKISKERRKEWEKEHVKEYRANNPEKKLLWAARNRSKTKGLHCDLVEEDIIVPTHCPYLGVELERHASKDTPRTNVMSLDRIDSSKGYTKDNIEVISWLANTMKNNATPEQLVTFAKAVLARYEPASLGCGNDSME